MNSQVQRNGQEILQLPKCEKTQDLRKKIQDIKTAIIFLKLRQEGCKKREAINFCQKTICKIDCSKQKDGPANCRILKPVHTKGLQINGWELTGNREYDMGKRYRNLSQLGIHSDEKDSKITNIIELKMKNNAHDYLYRIKVLENYINGIESKCKIPLQNIDLLQKKIQDLSTEIKQLMNSPNHFKCNGVQLYEIFQDYPQTQEQVDEYNSSYINLFDSFSHIYNNKEFQNQIEQNQIDSKSIPKKRPTIVTDFKKSFSISNSSRNSIESSSKILLLTGDDQDDKELSNEQIYIPQQSPQQSPSFQPMIIKNTKLQRQQTKSKFNTTFNQQLDKKDSVLLQSPSSNNNIKLSPKLKFIDMKQSTKNSYVFSEQDSLINGASQTGYFSFNQDSPQKKIQDYTTLPILNQMEFNQKIDWLINSAVINRVKQFNSPKSILPDDSKLNLQVQKIQSFKDKIMKKSMQNFYNQKNSTGPKTHAEFFKHNVLNDYNLMIYQKKNQKKQLGKSGQIFFQKLNSTYNTNLHTTGFSNSC